MLIGFDVTATLTSQPTGCARYAARLWDSLKRLAPGLEIKRFAKWSYRSGRNYALGGANGLSYYSGPLVFARGIDLFHGTDGDLPHWLQAARVVTIHDVATQRFQEPWFSPDAFRQRLAKRHERAKNMVDLVIVPSIATGNDVVELFGYDRGRIRIVPEGVDARFRPRPPNDPEVVAALARYNLEAGYLFFVGAISGRKNVERLIRAYGCSSVAGIRPLVLAGEMSYCGEPALRAIDELGLGGHVRRLGFVAESDLPFLYAAAAAFVFPTIYEGFGLPLLEAMSSGVPVLAGSLGAAPEVTGGYAILVDPFDVDAIAAGIDATLAIDAARLDLARHHALAFTWEAVARQTLDVYMEAMT